MNETLSNQDKKLIELYKTKWDEIRLIHNMQWKVVTVFGAIVVGSVVLTYEIPDYKLFFLSIAFLNILIGMFFISRYRPPFLTSVWVISKIEEKLEFHKEPWFPIEWKKIADKDLNSYVKNKINDDLTIRSFPYSFDFIGY